MTVFVVTLSSTERPVKHVHVNLQCITESYQRLCTVKVVTVHPLLRVKSSEVKDLLTFMLTAMLTACALLCSLTNQGIHKSGTRHDVTAVHVKILYSLHLAYISHLLVKYFRKGGVSGVLAV